MASVYQHGPRRRLNPLLVSRIPDSLLVFLEKPSLGGVEYLTLSCSE